MSCVVCSLCLERSGYTETNEECRTWKVSIVFSVTLVNAGEAEETRSTNITSTSKGTRGAGCTQGYGVCAGVCGREMKMLEMHYLETQSYRVETQSLQLEERRSSGEHHRMPSNFNNEAE
jgi:hypothetical protein